MKEFWIGWHQPVRGASGCGIFDRCMVSINRLLDRKSNFPVNDWIIDNGFTRLAAGKGCLSTRRYGAQIMRWRRCGNLTAAIAQDYVCTPAALAVTGLDVQTHQKLSVLRYHNLTEYLSQNSDEANYLRYCMDVEDGEDWLEDGEYLQLYEPEMALKPDVYIMPVLQGTCPSEYLRHIDLYSWRLDEGQWVGVGALKSKSPKQIEAILIAIKTYFPSLQLHGLGVAAKALRLPHVWHLLASADSQAHGIARGRDKQKYANSNKPQVALEYARSLFASAPKQLSLFGIEEKK